MALRAPHAGGRGSWFSVPKAPSGLLRGTGVLTVAVVGMWAATSATRRGRLRRVADAIGFPTPLTEATVDDDEVAIALVELSRAAALGGKRVQPAFCALVDALNGLLKSLSDIEALSPAAASLHTTQVMSEHADQVAQALDTFVRAARVPLATPSVNEAGEPTGETLLLGMPVPVDAQWAAAELALLRFADARVSLSAQMLHAATLRHALACGDDLAAMLGEDPARHEDGTQIVLAAA